MGWIRLDQDRFQWWAVSNAIIIFLEFLNQLNNGWLLVDSVPCSQFWHVTAKAKVSLDTLITVCDLWTWRKRLKGLCRWISQSARLAYPRRRKQTLFPRVLFATFRRHTWRIEEHAAIDVINFVSTPYNPRGLSRTRLNIGLVIEMFSEAKAA